MKSVDLSLQIEENNAGLRSALNLSANLSGDRSSINEDMVAGNPIGVEVDVAYNKALLEKANSNKVLNSTKGD